MEQIAIWASLIGDEVKNVSEDLQGRGGEWVQSRSTDLSLFLFPKSQRVRTAVFIPACTCTYHTVESYGAKITFYFQVCLAQSFSNLLPIVSVTVSRESLWRLSPAVRLLWWKVIVWIMLLFFYKVFFFLLNTVLLAQATYQTSIAGNVQPHHSTLWLPAF